MNGSPFGAAHQDVLGQTPTDPESKARLVEELKSRAKMAFARKDFPVCDALYSKALETLPDATLYSNRSAVRLGLGKFEDAFADATECTKSDPTYAKGFYRLGQAAEKCGKFAKAEAAYKEGAKLEPDSKVWPASLKKCAVAAKAWEAKPKKKAEVAPELESREEFVKRVGGTYNAVPTTKKPATGVDTKMRGYKLDSQGRKTTFFNNELTDEARALIGDIAPKKVDKAQDMTVQAGSSSWNQAGTFESKDHTKWLKARLAEVFTDFMVDLPDRKVGSMTVPCFLTVKKCGDIKGDASTAQARGKKKWVLDLSFKLDWEFPLDDKGAVAKGTMTFPDVSCDVVDDEEPLEYTLDVDPMTPREASPLIASHLQNADKGLRPAVFAVCADIVKEFRATK